MQLTKSDIAGRWSEATILSLWDSYKPDEDEPIVYWLTPDMAQLCCDCASNAEAEGVFSEDEIIEVDCFDPTVGCDECKTAIAFD